MMGNLFSIFDPSTSFIKVNWIYIISPILLMPTTLFNQGVNTTNFNILLSTMFKNLHQTLGDKKMSYFFLSSLMMMILIYNIGSLLPSVFSVSAHLSVVLPMGLLFWSLPIIIKLVKSPLTLLKTLLPQGTPAVLMPFMIIIEIVSLMIRPITLSVRLVANITAGHLLLSILISLTMNLQNNLFSIFPIFIMDTLELGVALIQGYVFFTLVSMFTSEI